MSNRNAIDGDSLAAKTSFFTTLPSDCSVCFTAGPSVRVTPNVQVEFTWITDVSWFGEVAVFDNPGGTGAPVLVQRDEDVLGNAVASAQHTVTIDVGPTLAANTGYFFKVTATDPNNSLPPFSTPTPLPPFYTGAQGQCSVCFTAGPSVRVTPNVQVEFKWITDVSWFGEVAVFDNPDGTGAPVAGMRDEDAGGSAIPSTQHTVTIPVGGALEAHTPYYFKVTATDPNGSLPPFPTPTPLPPFYTGAQVIWPLYVNAGPSRAIINWYANVIGIGHVDYGIASPDEFSVEDLVNGTSHSIELTGLAPRTTYQFRVSTRHAIDGDSLAEKTGSFTECATTTLDPDNPNAFFTQDGGQIFTSGNTLTLSDTSTSDYLLFFATDQHANAGNQLDLITTFQIRQTTRNNADAGNRIAISDGYTKSAVAACIVKNGELGIGLMSQGEASDAGTYPVFVAVDWLTARVTIRLRRYANGDAELVEVNGVAPVQRALLTADKPPGPTRAGFGCVEFGSRVSKPSARQSTSLSVRIYARRRNAHGCRRPRYSTHTTQPSRAKDSRVSRPATYSG